METIEATQELVANVVKKVLEELATGEVAPTEDHDGIYESVNDAVEAGLAAQKKLIAMSLEAR